MRQQEAYTIKLPTFEGPFDLLFHLVKKAEVDIWSVSIAQITEQYLAYLRSMKELNLEIASEFLVMAATLLRLKSKLLLPRPREEVDAGDDEELFRIDSAEELFMRLQEYRLFKEAAVCLRQREEEQQKIYLRSTGGRRVMVLTRQESVYTIWEGAHHLNAIMQRFAEGTMTDAYAPTFSAIDDFIISRYTGKIMADLSATRRPMTLGEFVQGESLGEVIIVFIALLELARRGEVSLLQERSFSPILVCLQAEPH